MKLLQMYYVDGSVTELDDPEGEAYADIRKRLMVDGERWIGIVNSHYNWQMLVNTRQLKFIKQVDK